VRKRQPNLASVLELLTHFRMFEACETLESGTRELLTHFRMFEACETLESATRETLESGIR
jgi:hypothetical protein